MAAPALTSRQLRCLATHCRCGDDKAEKFFCSAWRILEGLSETLVPGLFKIWTENGEPEQDTLETIYDDADVSLLREFVTAFDLAVPGGQAAEALRLDLEAQRLAQMSLPAGNVELRTAELPAVATGSPPSQPSAIINPADRQAAQSSQPLGTEASQPATASIPGDDTMGEGKGDETEGEEKGSN